MTPEEMNRVFEEYVAAANRHDGDAQMARMTEDCFFENGALGVRVEGQAAVAASYGAMLAAFPDYRREVEGRAFGEEALVAWWTLCGTMRGELFGQKPTGRAVRVPIVSIITMRDGLMHGERVMFDLATLCEQAGLSVGDTLAVVRELRGAAAHEQRRALRGSFQDVLGRPRSVRRAVPRRRDRPQCGGAQAARPR